MWWVWALVFALLVILGFEIRNKDLFDHVLELEDGIKRLRDEIISLKDEIAKRG